MILFNRHDKPLLPRILVALVFATSASHTLAKGGPKPQSLTPVPRTEPGAALAKTLLELRNNRLDAALSEVEQVVQRYPNFRLAHLIKGDLLLARSRPLREIGDAPNAPADQLQGLREEARARLARYQSERPTDRVPKYLLQLHAGQKHAIVVDTAQSTLYVFENRNGAAHYVADYYVSIGKNGVDKFREGDKKTPLGVYHVTANLPRAKLTDFYGSGAYPINYPNELDRRQGRNGYGIWLHGTPSDTYSRPPRASDGCVALTNEDLDEIGKNLQVGLTPVIISAGVEWVKPDALEGVRRTLLASLENWQRDWESLNPEAYARHYAPGFSSGSQDLAAWLRQKRQVNAGKTWVKLKLDRVSVFLYPGRSDLAVITFDQDYASSNLANQMKKRQYWIHENGAWRILHEGSA